MTARTLALDVPRGSRRAPTGIAAVAVIAGVLVALVTGSTLVVAIAVCVAALCAVLATPKARRALAIRRARRRRSLRNRKRTRRLEAAGVSTFEHEDLTAVAERVLADDPGDRLEIEELLDNYVSLAIERDRTHDELARIRRAHLDTRLTETSPASVRTRAMLERRIVHAATLAERAWDLDDATANVVGLIQLYADRMEQPPLVSDDDPLAWRLELLETAEDTTP